eukprot:CAMPEP_0115242736 /NCGR_PEP_ID=MMETSP0270-20121206/39110_1 /TAXON_ID=71861 /ORGANISM="Scrippsiella trochoidea, Strain CCMP3099" /LENGTH=187 /DNA_ID=CAMNT_0002657819 /DNA_START=166 /DNA_END=729 /DNA_ORIENTATION=+
MNDFRPAFAISSSRPMELCTSFRARASNLVSSRFLASRRRPTARKRSSQDSSSAHAASSSVLWASKSRSASSRCGALRFKIASARVRYSCAVDTTGLPSKPTLGDTPNSMLLATALGCSGTLGVEADLAKFPTRPLPGPCRSWRNWRFADTPKLRDLETVPGPSAGTAHRAERCLSEEITAGMSAEA